MTSNPLLPPPPYIPNYRTPNPHEIDNLDLWGWEPNLNKEVIFDYETGEFHPVVTVEDRLKYILNPSFTMDEVWDLTLNSINH